MMHQTVPAGAPSVFAQNNIDRIEKSIEQERRLLRFQISQWKLCHNRTLRFFRRADVRNTIKTIRMLQSSKTNWRFL